MSKTITVHDPRGYPPKVVGQRLANRLQSLDGKVEYVVDCLFENSDAFVEQCTSRKVRANLDVVVEAKNY